MTATRWPLTLVAALAAFALAAALVLRSGAVESGFGAYDDEPAHLVTALMLHDYLESGLREPPFEFAGDYYTHYPKVAIGQWPPVFHGVAALWMLVFGAGAHSIALLLAAVAAALATAVFATLRPLLGGGWGGLAAVTLLLLPQVQRLGHSVMTEILIAWLTFAAAASFGRFVQTGRARAALGFGTWAVLAILTKGSGLFLVGVPPLALLLSRRWQLLRRPALWAAAALVALLCGPWFVWTLDISRGTWSGGGGPSLDYVLAMLPFYGGHLLALGGVAMAALALFGLVERARHAPEQGVWQALLAWLVAALAGVLVVPTGGEARHLIIVAPPLVAGWAAGLAWCARRLPPRAGPLAAAAGVLLFALEAFELPRKEFTGFEAAAREVLARPELAGAAVLIASGPKGEGMFVAAMALRDQRPDHHVLRASKVLGRSDWVGRDYRPVFADSDGVAAFLAGIPVAAILLDASVEPRHRYTHDEHLRELVRRRPEVWQRIAQLDVVRAGVTHPGALEVFVQAGALRPPDAKIELDMVLGRTLPPGAGR